MAKSIDINNGIVGSLRESLDSIFSLRDDLGAALMPVFQVKRTWSGDEIGDGTAVEVKTQILPSPRIVSMKDASKIVDGGAVQLGDIILKPISKVSYQNKNEIDGSSNFQNIENFYEIDSELYNVINVVEKHTGWEVQIRKLSNQRRY